MTDFGLGRRPAPDPRDQNHLLRLHRLEPAQVVARRTKVWPMFVRHLNQGSEGTCVGHGWKHWLLTAPVIQGKRSASPTAVELYDAATEIDEWEENYRPADNWHDRQFGTSVRAGAKVLQRLGYIEEYDWLYDAETAADWIGGVNATGEFVGGSIVIGVNWYDTMDERDAEGFLHLTKTSRRRGGHCVDVRGYHQRSGYFYGIQSWNYGPFKIAGEALDRLLREDGEGCTAKELRLAA